MATETIEINRQISRADWLEFFDTFTNDNRGRLLTIELLDQELGDQELIKAAPLWAIARDPTEKGDVVMIETGRETVSYAHTIDAPIDVWVGQDENGVVLVLKITDAKGNHILLKFQRE
ncbi:DUF5335 family protein [Leptothermofonsia sp. ETS-13]|uniref:DUF5335 family protein n=1 Tax=Leptothermofonsia sp. ETS-13 TaxID=3035696 RepID=UPI003BA09627